MRTTIVKIPHRSRSDVIRLYPIGDTHLGAGGCNEGALKARVQEIKADRAGYWCGMGDYCDFINLSDPRFAAGILAPWVQVTDLDDLSRVQRDYFLDLVGPIADKCLFLLKGNHENTIHRYYERAIYDEIVAGVRDRMKKPPEILGLGYCGFAKLEIDRATGDAGVQPSTWRVDIFAHHGWGGGRLAGAKALKLERAMMRYNAHLYLIGHWHTLTTQTANVIGITSRARIRRSVRKGTVTGTWLQSPLEDVEGYAEIAGYPPAYVGSPIVRLRCSDKSIHIQI